VAAPSLVPALALVIGATVGIFVELSITALVCVIPPVAVVASILWCRQRLGLSFAFINVVFVACGAALAADARADALQPSIRSVLDRHISGFAVDTPGPPGLHAPISIRIRLSEDASQADDVTTMRARILAVRIPGQWHTVDGGLFISVAGAAARREGTEWVAGRTLEMPVTFRRPARFLNDGVPDFERDLALDGTTLFASTKSGLLIKIVDRGNAVEEVAARVRRHVRRSVSRWVGTYDQLSASIVAAVLIGDRTGLPDDVRERLQAAGTYHVIAISGGNIAILAGLCLWGLRLAGSSGRLAAAITLATLVAYALVVTSGASVWRATVMAVVYLGARLLDHRSAPWQAFAITAAIILCVRPLDVRDVGFMLTFGATAALLEVASRMSPWRFRHWLIGWIVASMAASLGAEAALLPVSAFAFSRVTIAGLLLNLVAVPLMGVVQVTAIVIAIADHLEWLAHPVGWLAHSAARALVESARLVEVMPWLSARVPPPSLMSVVIYYASLIVVLTRGGRARHVAACVLAGSALFIAGGISMPRWPSSDPPALRMTVFDVGQGEAILLRWSATESMIVDSGGTPFGSGGLNIGSRVLAPALWAQGVRMLQTMLVTHGDPDHLGGARAVMADFAPSQAWEGIPVPEHGALQEWIADATRRGIPVRQRLAGDRLPFGNARLRVLHPQPADWERQRVRNDDSVVIEVVFGEVAILLTGDIGAEIERKIVPQLTPTRIRVLKVAHHGSRTSSSRDLLEAWRPQIAVISCGRGNSFGHPAPEVLRRLDAVGATVFRTDRDGQITLETNGHQLSVRTYVRGFRL
jgi:competence protein ComEC